MEKEKEVKIEKMVLNIDGEKVSLSMEQAKKLKKILDELFGKEIVREVHHEHHYDWWYKKPYYWDSGNLPKLGDIVYCDNAQLQVNV